MKTIVALLLVAFCVMLASGALAQEKGSAAKTDTTKVMPKKQAPTAPAKTEAPKKPGTAAMMEKKAAVKGEEYYHMMATQTRNINEHARMMYHHAATRTEATMNREVMREHVNDIGASLESTKKYLARVEEGMSQAEKTDSKAVLDEMHEDMAKMDAAYKSLKSEVESPQPKPEAMRQQAATMHQQSEMMMKSQKAMQEKYNVPEPPPPPVMPQPEQ